MHPVSQFFLGESIFVEWRGSYTLGNENLWDVPGGKRLMMHSIIAKLLILLFAWQAGACPCGCTDHNAWIDLISHDQPTEDLAGFVRVAAGTVSLGYRGHCDGPGRPPYLRDQREPERRARGGSTALWGHLLVPTLPASQFASTLSGHSPHLERQSKLRRPPPRQAVLQIWLI
jgi:hypothetical protein